VTLKDFPFLTDQNIHPDVVAHLRQLGLDVLTAADCVLASAPDEQILQRAHLDHRLVLTHDADFGTLAIAQQKPLVGIVYLRPGHILPTFTIQTLEVLFSATLDLRPPFVLVAHRQGRRVKVRLRQW
jgi:predicted nuclease of predicted toxin-antitoxin system